ncbi:MAG: flagellar assembly protein FliW [Desulfarculaceae bacterium]|jgi:flagellar assembly factor FliW
MAETSPNTTIKVITDRFGEITVSEDQVVTLPNGMVGFPELHRYVLLQHREGSPFHWLQSLERRELAFVMVSPLLFDSQYQVSLGNTEVKLLNLEDPKTIQVWTVVTIPHGRPEKMTANLKAPVIINLANRLAAQIILDDPKYPLRQPLPDHADT